jgi:thiol-disulfide isomerase/thioredoxin
VDGAQFSGLDALPKPAVIYFWASWCGICKAMQGTMAGLAAEIPVITVATQSGDRGEVANYQRHSHFSVPTILDEDGELARSYGLRGVPAFFIIGRDGEIRFATTGLTSAWGIRLRLWLAGQ